MRKYYSRRSIAGPIVLLLILAYFWLRNNPQVLTFILIGLGILAVIALTISILHKKRSQKSKKIENVNSDYIPVEEAHEPDKYVSKKLMTNTEELFYNTLNEIVGADFIVQPQINLATVIKKESKAKYQNELYRNIDFGIFKKSNYELLLLIELNDQSHNDPKRKQRDIKVKNICSEANIPLISFWLSMPNTKEYISNRLKQFLEVT